VTAIGRPTAAQERSPAYPSLGEAARVWARVAALSFGGPAGQIAVMYRILVEELRWISQNRFLHALNYCMLLPGPEAQQLATYVGWLLHGTRGGFVAGLLFILPGMAAIMALSVVYALVGQVGFVAAMFFGLKSAVLAIVLQAVLRLGSRALRGPAMVAIAAAAFLAIFVVGVPFPLIVIAAGLVGLAGALAGWRGFAAGAGPKRSGLGGPAIGYVLDDLSEAGPARGGTLAVAAACLLAWLLPVALIVVLLGPQDRFGQIALLFTKMAVVTFGGAYAALAYVAQQAVETYGWLSPGEMLDGLGMAETTPGPLIMVLQFVGFMAAFRHPGALTPLWAGTLGGLLATWVTFAPCFLWIFLGAPWIEELRGNKALSGALAAITAAVVGVILNLAIWFAIHTLFHEVRHVGGPLWSMDVPVPGSLDPWALGLAAAAMLATFALRIGMITTLAACSAAGVLLYLAGVIGP
jgi:chromate transporter